MSKKVKPRKKKGGQSTINKQANNIIKHAVNALGSMYLTMTSEDQFVKRNGMSGLARNLSSGRLSINQNGTPRKISPVELAVEEINAMLNNHKRTWQYWMVIYTEEGNTVESSVMAGSVESITTPELRVLLEGMLNDFRAESTDPDPKWAWAIAPSLLWDFDADEDKLMGLFVGAVR